jgi:pilus assembly protein Flp/PilA
MIQYLNILLNARLAKVDERGATAVEYGLLVALIAGVIIAVVGFLGQDILGAFDGVENGIGGDQGGGAPAN